MVFDQLRHQDADARLRENLVSLSVVQYQALRLHGELPEHPARLLGGGEDAGRLGPDLELLLEELHVASELVRGIVIRRNALIPAA